MSGVTPLDLGILRRGIEARDARAVMRLYADDAEVTLVDKTAPASGPHQLHGKDEIEAHWREVLGREMTHQVTRPVVGGDRASYAFACRHRSGERVLCVSTLELAGGKIVRELFASWNPNRGTRRKGRPLVTQRVGLDARTAAASSRRPSRLRGRPTRER